MKHYISLPEDHLFVGGVAVVQTLDSEGRHSLLVLPLGDIPLWSQIGLLQGAMDKQRELLKSLWGK